MLSERPMDWTHRLRKVAEMADLSTRSGRKREAFNFGSKSFSHR